MEAPRARFAVVRPGASEAPRSEPAMRKVIPRRVARPRRIETIERAQVEAAVRAAERKPPEAELTRLEHEAPPRAERVSVTARLPAVSSPQAARPSSGRLRGPQALKSAAEEGSASVRSPEGGVRAARLLDGHGKPRYPGVCQRKGLEGDGEYLLAIDEAGRVTDARVLKSAGHPEFDKSARRFFLYRARYEPATLDGVPIPFTRTVRVSFELELE